MKRAYSSKLPIKPTLIWADINTIPWQVLSNIEALSVKMGDADLFQVVEFLRQ